MNKLLFSAFRPKRVINFLTFPILFLLFSTFRRKRMITFLVFSILFLQVVLVPTAVGPPVIQTDYGTAKELDTFFKSVNERNDGINDTVVSELN